MKLRMLAASPVLVVLVVLFLAFGQNRTETADPADAATAPLSSTSATTVTWTTVAPMLTPRSGPGLAATTDGKLYAIGGDNDTHDPVLDTLSSVEMYDPVANTWTPKASMPTKRAWLAAATASNGKIYAIGGAQCQNCSGLTTVEEYDPISNTWASKASMPTGRQGLAAVAANDKVYVLGGYNGQQLSTVEEYNPATNSWRSVQSMPSAREHLAAVLGPDGLIYAIGGGPSNIVEAYNPVLNTWTRLADMPTARWALGAALGPNGRIYAIGGNGPSNVVEEYDPVGNTWAAQTSMPTPRQSLAVVRAANGRIYAVGGELAANPNLATVEEATITSAGTSTSTATPTTTATPSPTSTATSSPTPTSTATKTPAPLLYLPLVLKAQPTATPTSTPTPTPTFTSTATASPTPSCSTSVQALRNPSFEDGFTSWGFSTGSLVVVNDTFSDGQWSLRVGGLNNESFNLAQFAGVPTWADFALLMFDWRMSSSDSTMFGYDVLRVTVAGPDNTKLSETAIWNNGYRGDWTSWAFRINNLSSLRGRDVVVGIWGQNDRLYPTTWWVDNVRLYFGCGSTSAARDAGALYLDANGRLYDAEAIAERFQNMN